jgi:hypothetical protein
MIICDNQNKVDGAVLIHGFTLAFQLATSKGGKVPMHRAGAVTTVNLSQTGHQALRARSRGDTKNQIIRSPQHPAGCAESAGNPGAFFSSVC